MGFSCLWSHNAWHIMLKFLTHRGQVKHIYAFVNLYYDTNVSDNGLPPVWGQAIIWTTADILVIRPLGINFSEIRINIQNIFIQEYRFENVVCNMVASMCSKYIYKICKFSFTTFRNFLGLIFAVSYIIKPLSTVSPTHCWYKRIFFFFFFCNPNFISPRPRPTSYL